MKTALLLTAPLAALLATPASARPHRVAPPATSRAEAPLPPAQAAAIDAAVEKALAETGTPSVQLAVVRNGRLAYVRAYGKAGEGMPAATSQPYQIASNSKQFLGALLLLLEADGKLKMTDTVEKFLPRLPHAREVTIRQLLSHTSGLQDYWPQDYLFNEMTKPVDPAGIVARWAAKPLDYAPGTRWQYSNTGYVVAGLVAEKAGGAPLWTQFRKRIFAPLGMKVLPVDETNGPGFPQGYHRNALGPVHTATPPAKGWLWAAGELSMSAADLAKWDIARINRTLLPARAWAAQETPVILRDGINTGYGLGVSIGNGGGRRAIFHGGESVGFLSQNTVFPDSRAAIVVLTNGDFADVSGMVTKAVADIVIPRDAPPDNGEAGRLDDAKAEFAALAKGTFAPDHFTEHARFYFDAQARADYVASLGPLGEPTAFTAPRGPRLRGGFVNRNYEVTAGGKKLTIITYAEPGEHGKWEQFLVMPGD